ncbi:hypothetical protein AMECASPLE_038554 [Ameca splendens]|uniref:Secreted protein n=1 Tax=Ameca splendens TaxID=208324 RepID=A0ABV0YWK6_9TELE
MLSAVVVLGAVQTPGLVSFAKRRDMTISSATNSPHRKSNVHPASLPLHFPVVALSEALVTQDLGDTFKPFGVIWVLLELPDPGYPFTSIMQKERCSCCVCVKGQDAYVCKKERSFLKTAA